MMDAMQHRTVESRKRVLKPILDRWPGPRPTANGKHKYAETLNVTLDFDILVL